jgi:hypothetical protein
MNVSYESCDGGLRLLKLFCTDDEIVVPDNINGEPVVSIGPRAFESCPQSGLRSLRIPISVRSADHDTLFGLVGLTDVIYEGTVEMFSDLRLFAYCDVTVKCADGFRFRFPKGFSMSFPDFDKEYRAFGFRSDDDVVISRLADPRMMEQEYIDFYQGMVRRRMMPRSEHAVAHSDTEELRTILSTGLMTDEDLVALLDLSLKSGKISVTSLLMSERRKLLGRQNQA